MRVGLLCLALVSGSAPGSSSAVLDAGGEARATSGTWYVYQPQLRYASAGGAAMHDLCGELLRQGAKCRMAYVNPKLAHLVGPPALAAAANMTSDEVAALWARGLDRDDTLIAPEVAPEFVPIPFDGHIPHSQGTSDARDVARNVQALEQRGGVIARWMLGAAQDWGDRVSEEISVHIGASSYLHDTFGGAGPGPVSVWPLEAALVHRATAWLASGDAERAARKMNEEGRAVVVLDDDVDLDVKTLQRALDRASPNTARAVRFSGFSREEAYALFERTSVYVDLHLPGLEAGVCEFAMFGARVVLTAFGHGEAREYPSSWIRVLEDDADTVAKAALASLSSPANESYAYGAWCRGIPARFGPGVAAWRASRATAFVTYAAVGPDFAALAPLFVSMVVRHAFSTLTVVVATPEQRNAFWQRFGPATREALRRLGLLRRIRVAACESCFGVAGLAAAALDHARDTSELAVLLPPRAHAPRAEAIRAALSTARPGGCAVAATFAACGRGATDEAAAVADALRAAPPAPPGDCADMWRHALWRQIAPTLSPPSRTFFEAECKQQAQPNASIQMAADYELRAVCPNEHYRLSARRRYEWNSRAPDHLTQNPRFDFGLNASLLEIGGPTPHAGFIYDSVARADNVAERNIFALMHQWGAYPEEGDFDGHPFAPMGTVMGTTYQRHAARLVGVPDVAYDVIMASHVLEHVLDPIAALREWDRKLKPGGWMLLLLPWAPNVDYDARREPANMQQLVHLAQRDASFDAKILSRHAEQLLLVWPNLNRSDLFSRCAPGVDAGDASCGVDENRGHWHVWDFDLLQEAVEGCLGYDLEVMTLQDPWHQIVLAQKPPSAPRSEESSA